MNNIVLQMIEESEERLSEEQVTTILQLMLKHFPHIQEEESEKASPKQNE